MEIPVTVRNSKERIATFQKEALECGMRDVIKIRFKRRYATRSGKRNQPLNIKAAVERPILKLGLPNFRWSFYFILLLVASPLFRRNFMTSHKPELIKKVSMSILNDTIRK